MEGIRMHDGNAFAAPRDFMRLAGAPVLVATILLGATQGLAGPGHAAYGRAFDLGLGIVAGSLLFAASLLAASLSGHLLLPGPRSREWVGRGAWAASRLSLVIAGLLAIATALPVTGGLWG